MFQFKKIVPVLRVEEMDRALDFYKDLLRFDIHWRAPGDGDGENAMLCSGVTTLMLSTGSHVGDKPKFSGTFYFETEKIRELWERVKDQVTIVWPLEYMSYGQWEFGIQDRDGYTLAFAEEGPATEHGR